MPASASIVSQGTAVINGDVFCVQTREGNYCKLHVVAYVTERAGNLLKVDLTNANRSAAAVVCSGLTAPQQLWVDEVHHQLSRRILFSSRKIRLLAGPCL